MKASRLVAALGLSVLALTACGGEPGAKGGQGGDMLLGTAGSGGTYFYVGQAMASTVSKDAGARMSAQGTAGGVENLRRINSGTMQFGLASQGDVRTVVADKSVDLKNIRLVMVGHPNVAHIVTESSSGLSSIDDLFKPGKRIGLGEPGSDLHARSKGFLEAAGLSLEQVEGAPLSQAEQATALQDGSLDGAILGGGVPVTSVNELASRDSINILELPKDYVAKLKPSYPEYAPYVIKAGTYKGVDTDVETVQYPTMMFASASVDAETVKKVVKAILDNSDQMAKVHPAAAEWNKDRAMQGSEAVFDEFGDIQFHDGATAAFKDLGIGDGAS